MAAYDTTIYRIRYRQKVLSDSVKYILTSTNEWSHPLESAEYKLIVKNTFEINTFSYEPDQLYSIDGENIYYWNRQNFMPKSDMIFYLR
jgi:hypothetical protein